MGTHWYELVRQLQGAAELQRERFGKQLEQRNVSGVLSKAVEVARKDSDWNSSGLPESLQRALDLCDKQGPAAAVAAALRLLDFQQIVEAKSGNSPKGSPKQGQHAVQTQLVCAAHLPHQSALAFGLSRMFACCAEAKVESTTELHVPRSETQLADSLSRTSVPVITIKRSSEARAIPTTTTIVLQPSLVQSNIAQRDDQVQSQIKPDHTPDRQMLSSAKAGSTESGKLHVLKSKNGRSNGSSLSASTKLPSPANYKPSCIVREVQNGQRPEPPSEEATRSNSSSRPAMHAVHVLQPGHAPMRAGSPPPSGTAPSTVTTSSSFSKTDHPKNHSGEKAGMTNRQVNFSPFQAEEAQSHEHQQLESRHSNSDSDKSCESAGEVVLACVHAVYHIIAICASSCCMCIIELTSTCWCTQAAASFWWRSIKMWSRENALTTMFTAECCTVGHVYLKPLTDDLVSCSCCNLHAAHANVTHQTSASYKV